MNVPVLEVRDLRVEFRRRGRDAVVPIDGVSFSVEPGECLGLVGESGSGKSLSLKAIMGLLPRYGTIAGGDMFIDRAGSREPLVPEKARGTDIAMVFQEPMTALNPTMRAGDLIAEAGVAHGAAWDDARAAAIDLMRDVGIPDPAKRAEAWPHELSGGLRQRVMIAMALACNPRVLLCDEPTTALDVTIQDQILALLDRLRQERNLAIVFVTHDLGVVAQVADRVAVMYAGRTVESGAIKELFTRPRHPYSLGLLRSVPSAHAGEAKLVSIGGQPPDPRRFPPGCRFAPRCSFAQQDCTVGQPPPLVLEGERASACLHVDALAGERGIER